MILTDSPKEASFRAELRAWLRAQLDDARRARIESAIVAGDPGPSREWHRQLHDAGYAVRSWPKAYGGQDGALGEDLILFEELALADAPNDIFRVGTRIIGPMLMKLGTQAQKERLLPDTANGTCLWCQGFSEPDAGSDLASLRTRARRAGERFVLNGQKIWNTFGHMADYCLFLVRTGEAGSRHRGLSAFVVPMDTPGITIQPIPQISGRSDFNVLFLDHVEVPESALVGELDEGWRVAVTMLDFERRGLAAIGFDCLRSFRRLHRLAATLRRPDAMCFLDDPVMVRRLAEWDIQVRIAVLNNHRFAAMVPESEPPGAEASMQKLHATELNKALCGAALELLMEADLTNEAARALLPCVAEDAYGAFGFTVGGGTAQIQRNIIAERVLGLPR